MQNNDRRREDMDREEQELTDLIAGYLEVNSNANVLHLQQQLAALRMRQHPDDWFIDPGSGRETEDGRRRRRAKQACWADCPMKARLLCLDRGLQEGHTLNYGIYGGREEKWRQAVVEARKEREKRVAPSSETR
jgi:hypothetical protein